MGRKLPRTALPNPNIKAVHKKRTKENENRGVVVVEGSVMMTV